MNPSEVSCAGNTSKSSVGIVATNSLAESVVDDITLEGGVSRRSSESGAVGDIIGGVDGRGSKTADIEMDEVFVGVDG